MKNRELKTAEMENPTAVSILFKTVANAHAKGWSRTILYFRDIYHTTKTKVDKAKQIILKNPFVS